MNVNVRSESDILFINSSSLSLQGNDMDASQLLLQTNVNCGYDDNLFIRYKLYECVIIIA